MEGNLKVIKRRQLRTALPERIDIVFFRTSRREKPTCLSRLVYSRYVLGFLFSHTFMMMKRISVMKTLTWGCFQPWEWPMYSNSSATPWRHQVRLSNSATRDSCWVSYRGGEARGHTDRELELLFREIAQRFRAAFTTTVPLVEQRSIVSCPPFMYKR